MTTGHDERMPDVNDHERSGVIARAAGEVLLAVRRDALFTGGERSHRSDPSDAAQPGR